MTHLFIYNGLKLGGKYNPILRAHGGVFAGSARVDGYALWKVAGDLPAAIEDRCRSIYGELWVVSDRLLDRLDGFEGVSSGAFVRQFVKINPLKTVFDSRDPFLGEMYVWTHGHSEKDVLQKSGVY